MKAWTVRLLIAGGFLLSAAGAASAAPDLTGLWSHTGRSLGGAATALTAPALPLTPKGKAKVEAFQAIVAESGETPGMYCLGAGMPMALGGAGGYPMEIVQRPEQINVIFELHGELRHIYFGKRDAPQEDRVPGRGGYSSGHWDGDTLVVETDNLVEQLDTRFAHSDQARIVERYRLDKPDAQGHRVLVDEVVLTDPVFYTEPVRFEERWVEVPNGRLLNYECAEDAWRTRIEVLAKAKGLAVP